MNTKTKIQKFGGVLTNMVLPNIGAFIAWGFITALFIPTGWLPNERLNEMVSPMLTYVLPLLVAYTGGEMFGGKRGAVLAVVSTLGCIAGSDVTMFLGAMILGPLSGWLIKKADAALDGRVPAGFEMVVNNFSIGMIGLAMAIVAYYFFGPAITAVTNALQACIQFFVDRSLLPLLSLFNEPAKVLFINNAISQGIYSPLGLQDAVANGTGSSLYFMTDSNPGPGLGLLLAYFFFSKRKAAKKSAPTAAIIHFFGGIHEMYFPYVFMKPIMIVPMILGGMGGIVTAQLFQAALIAQPSPGSVFAVLALTPKGKFLANILWIAVGTLITFVTAAFIFKVTEKDAVDDEGELALEEAKKQVQKAKHGGAAEAVKTLQDLKKEEIRLIVFACDAGMGSSAMADTVIKKKLRAAGIPVEVRHSNLEAIPAEADLVICHTNLKDRAHKNAPDKAILPVSSYLDAPEYEDLIAFLKG